MRSNKNFITAALLIVGSLLTAPQAHAAHAVYTGTFSNDALSGYDTVAYFTEKKPVKGVDTFKTQHQGATWYFSSQANLDAFIADPDIYAPQYGGYCAYAVGAKNELVSADPEAWKIVNNKLYLNYDSDIQAQWAEKQSEYITKADANWPNLSKE